MLPGVRVINLDCRSITVLPQRQHRWEETLPTPRPGDGQWEQYAKAFVLHDSAFVPQAA